MENFDEAIVGSDDKNLKLISLIYLGSIIIFPLVFVGVILAYMNKSNASDTMKPNYQYCIRTFWITLFYTIISVPLVLALGLGFLLMFFAWISFIVRSIKLYQYAGRNEMIPKPKSWIW